MYCTYCHINNLCVIKTLFERLKCNAEWPPPFTLPYILEISLLWQSVSQLGNIFIISYLRSWIIWGQEQAVEQFLRGGRGARGQAGRRQEDQQAGTDHLCRGLRCLSGTVSFKKNNRNYKVQFFCTFFT